jgi:hypothetical protein
MRGSADQSLQTNRNAVPSVILRHRAKVLSAPSSDATKIRSCVRLNGRRETRIKPHLVAFQRKPAEVLFFASSY